MRSSVVSLRRRARSCCCAGVQQLLPLAPAAVESLQRCATRSVATIECAGPGEQQELRFYYENAILWAKLAASAAGSEFFWFAKRVLSKPMRPEASSLARREFPALLLPGSKYLQDVKPGSDGQRCLVIGQPRVRKLRVLHHQYALVWAARIGLGCDQARRSRLSCRNCSW